MNVADAAPQSGVVGARSELDALFAPRSIAVVGASAGPGKLGAAAMAALADYAGPVWAVNPRSAGPIAGRPTVPNVAAISEEVDLALLCVPSSALPDAVAEAAGAGVRAGVIFAGGLAETGAAGAALQQRTVTAARAGGMRLLGPNTAGFVNPPAGVRASFAGGVAALRPGPLAVISQSAGMGLTLAWLAHEDGCGIRLYAGVGNAADIDLADVLDYVTGDDELRAVVLHLEGTGGRRLAESVARATERVGVVALKLGRSDVSAFAASHTGALTGSFALTRAALQQAGAVLADDARQAVAAARALTGGRLRPGPSPGVAVVTAQAGPGLAVEDALRSAGTDLPALGEVTRERLDGLLPPMTYLRNPVDTGRPGPSFGGVLAAVASDPAIDAVAVWALCEPDAFDPVAAVRDAGMASTRMLFASQGEPVAREAVLTELAPLGATPYRSPEDAAQGLIALTDDARAAWRRTRGSPGRAGVPALPSGPIDEAAAKDMIDCLGLRTPRREVCATRALAHRARHRLGGGPVVVKALSPHLAHKSEAGGVHVGVTDATALEAALDAIDAIDLPAPASYLVEAQAPAGVELMLGVSRDRDFGPSVLVGVGGVEAEALGDVAVRPAPLTEADAVEMIGELRAQRLLNGFRGRPVVSRSELAVALVALGALAVAHPSLAELDLNPVRATDEGLVALDALIVVSHEATL